MANNIEWGHANYGGALLTPEEVLELTQDEDDTAGDWAIEIGSDGAMLLFGTPEQLHRWLTRALVSLEEPLREARNAGIKAHRKAAGWGKCRHEWQLTEDGYVRTWSTQYDPKAGTLVATFNGTDDFSDSGTGEYLQCTQCGRVKRVPAGVKVDYR